MKIEIAADPVTQKAIIATAAASGGAAWWTAAKEIALELFGVPLPVVLAAATGAFGALSFVSATSYPRTLGMGTLWTFAGTYGAQLALWLVGWWAKAEVPAVALPGVAILLAACGPLIATRDNIDRLRAAIGRRIDALWSKP